MGLTRQPLTLKQANDMVEKWHRHHKPARGHRFSVGAFDGDVPVGAAITGRPVARAVPQYTVAEVIRCVTNGTKNACSLLYSASARAAEALGFNWIQTYILKSEHGSSLAASGWYPITAQGIPCGCKLGEQCGKCTTAGGDWNTPTRGGRRTDQPQEEKQRWGRNFRVKGVSHNVLTVAR
jgi:hypothetical protein